MRLRVGRRRALHRIEQSLVAEDPRLGSLFAVFTRLTLHEALPGIEQVTGRLRRLLRPAAVVPLTLLALVGMLAATWLIPGGHACPTTPAATGHSLSVSRTARCQPGPAMRLDRDYVH
jgi:hypothetical protein